MHDTLYPNRINRPNTIGFLIGWSFRDQQSIRPIMSQMLVKIFTLEEIPSQLAGIFSHDTHMFGLATLSNQRTSVVINLINIMYIMKLFSK